MITREYGVAGQFRAVVECDGVLKRDTGYFDNMIVDAGLHRFGQINAPGNPVSPATAFNSVAGRFVVGTGSKPVRPDDTALDNLTAAANSDSAFVSHELHYLDEGTYSITVTYKFTAGHVVGSISEMGLQNPSGLFSRSLIVGGDGTPQPVDVLATDTFSCFYKFTIFMPRADKAFQIFATVDGEPRATTTTFRVLGADDVNIWYFKTAADVQPMAYTGGLGSPVADKPEGTLIGVGGSVTAKAYGNDYKREFDITIPQGTMTSEQLATMVIHCMMGAWQMNFNPPLQKNAAKDMELTVGYSWARQ